MVDQIQGSITSSVQTPISSSQDATSAKRQAQLKDEDRAVESQKIKISDVAQRASNEKKKAWYHWTRQQMSCEKQLALSTRLQTPTKAIITRDEELNRFIVRIADKSSGEVVREIPSEALLKFARNLQELKGLIFDRSL